MSVKWSHRLAIHVLLHSLRAAMATQMAIQILPSVFSAIHSFDSSKLRTVFVDSRLQKKPMAKQATMLTFQAGVVAQINMS